MYVRPRAVVGAGELNGARAAAEADALAGERLVHRGGLGAGDAGSARCSAAWAPNGSAAWQLIRSGRPDGAAASPAATMRGSSTLVSVSSVSNRPSASVVRPLAAARSGHAEARRPHRHRAGQHRDRRRAPRGRRPPAATACGVHDGDAQRGQPLGHRAPARRRQRRGQHVAADQRDGAALLGELGGTLDAGQPAADHHDRRRCGGSRPSRRATVAPAPIRRGDKRIRRPPGPPAGTAPVLPTA